MKLEFPADAQIQVFIVPSQSFPVPGVGAAPASLPQQPPRWWLLKGTVVLALVGSAFVLGSHVGGQRTIPPAYAQAAMPPGSPAAPDRSGPTEMPPAFAQQLQRPPTVTPAPGSPPAGSPGKSAFGLED